MKKSLTRIGLFLSMLCVIALTSCEKNAVPEISRPPQGPQIKFYNFGLNAPAVNFYVGNQKVSGVSSTTGVEAAGGTVFGGVYPTTGYSAVPAGGELTARTSPTALTNPGVTIATASGSSLEDGKQYSFYVAGAFDAGTLKADAFILQDEMPGNDTSSAFVRFVNAGVAAAGPLTVTLKNQTNPDQPVITLTSNLAFKSATEFTRVPRSLYEVSVKDNTSGFTFVRTGVTFSADRVYTLSMRGNVNIATGRLIDNTVNR